MSQEAEVRKAYEEWERTGWLGSNKAQDAAWLAWQEQEKKKDILCATLKIMNATCTIANEVLEEQLPKIATMQELIAEQRIRIGILENQMEDRK